MQESCAKGVVGNRVPVKPGLYKKRLATDDREEPLDSSRGDGI